MWNDQADWISKHHLTAVAPSFYVYVLEVQYFSLPFLRRQKENMMPDFGDNQKNKSDIMPWRFLNFLLSF